MKIAFRILPRLVCCVACLLSPPVAPAQPAPGGSTPPLVPAGVLPYRDISYVVGGHERQKLDLYVPEQGNGPFPVIVWVHGGGWAAGDKNGCPPLTSGFVGRGYAAASLGYRLSGHATFPAQIEDCKAALRWLRAHAKQYRLDPNRIGVWGSSAGGHLVALLGTSGDVREFEVGQHLDQSSRVQAVADFFGPTDFLQMDAHAVSGSRLVHNSERSPESRLVGGPIQERAPMVHRANPITYVTKDDPPFVIVHGDADPLVPHHQSEILYAALTQEGVPVRFITVAGGGHGQGFPHRELNPILGEFFDRHLKGVASAANWPAATRSEVKAEPVPARGKSAEKSVGAPLTPAQTSPAATTAEASSIDWKRSAVTAPDGVRSPLFWAAPPGSGPFPVIIFLHGAPGGAGEAGIRRLLGSSRWTRYLAEGFAVCVADYRGHAQDKPFDVIKGDVDATHDLAAVVKFLGEQPVIDERQVVVTGQSLGGLIALETVSRGRITPVAMVASAPATFPFIGYQGGRGGAPDRELADTEFDRSGTAARIASINVPVLLLQGTADGLCKLNKALYSVMKAAGKGVRMELFEGAGHGFINGPDGVHYQRALDLVVAFAHEHARRRVAAATPARPAPTKAGRGAAPGEPKPEPALANAKYGENPRQRFDLWRAESSRPTPLVLFIHGGGFIGGSKDELNARDLNQLLASGISVAAIEYRLIADAKLPAAHHDAVRALQFLRSNAREWNFDKTRIGAFGGSAGAQLCMYLAFHDDLADSRSSDAVARESTRLACVAPSAGQITMDMNWWRANIPDAYAQRTNEELFGLTDDTAALKINARISALSLISRDDPPVFMSYAMAPDASYPENAQIARNWKIHHVIHGVKLKERCDELGVEAHLRYPGADTKYPSGVQFLIAKLTK